VLSVVLAAATLTACPATVVRYDTAVPHAGAVSLPGYVRTLRDGRVNSSDGLVLWRRGASLAWKQPGVLVARRLDRPGRFRTSRAVVRFPAPGCWRLTSNRRSVIARVVENPEKLFCEITVLESGRAYARPRDSGIWGGWPWLPIAQLTTHGHDGDQNMKVPWWVRNGGSTLQLEGIRLDAAGSFRQAFPMAGSPRGVYPSIVDVPAAGCWLLRLSTGTRAGVLVIRAVDAHG
jgi:hypothetical protein